ncbi:hypothetical protein AV530_017034 [Patagioenas fasciata monilis]|uniref:Uncharacterized protein n=1 Tax=Patagioenas fasciata monilis TaxID=372326 RepID=A0A1V4J542_PATFA|nr:hypothetical protein AV530_017034 [Patagioenas fasciata monilis]
MIGRRISWVTALLVRMRNAGPGRKSEWLCAGEAGSRWAEEREAESREAKSRDPSSLPRVDNRGRAVFSTWRWGCAGLRRNPHLPHTAVLS